MFPLLPICHKPHCQQFSLGLFLWENLNPIKTVYSKVFGVVTELFTHIFFFILIPMQTHAVPPIIVHTHIFFFFKFRPKILGRFLGKWLKFGWSYKWRGAVMLCSSLLTRHKAEINLDRIKKCVLGIPQSQLHHSFNE